MPTKELTLTEMIAANPRDARVVKAQTIVAYGKPQPVMANIQNRTLSVIHTRAPWVDRRGNLNVRVRVLENGTPRGIGRRKVRDEHIQIVNPPVMVPTGATRVVDIDGVPTTVAVFEENPRAALREVVRQTLGLIGISDRAERLFGNTTTVVYPDAGTAGTAGDTVLYYFAAGGGGIPFASIVAQAESNNEYPTSTVKDITIRSGSTSGNYDQLMRAIWCFDTPIGADQLVSTVTLTLSHNVTGKTNSFATDPDVVVQACAPLDPAYPTHGDFDSFSGDELGRETWAEIVASTSVDIPLTASCVNTTGITSLMGRFSWDFSGVPPTWASNKVVSVYYYQADQAGTTNDPKLTIEHAAAASGGGARAAINLAVME